MNLTRREVDDLPEYVPGKSAAGAIKLASNENPFGPSPKALEAIAREAKNLHAYPDQKSLLLREALGKQYDLPESFFICGNGADDLIQIIAATYLNPGDEVIISKNTFSVYELVTRLFGGRPVFVDLKDFEIDLAGFAAAVTPKTKLIFFANPNNPTGTAVAAKEFDEFMMRVPDQTIVVVDEAYADFVERKDFPDTIKYVSEGRNIIVLRTFSKFYGLAGLRVGYAISKKELVLPMFKAKMPFNVNRLAQAGAAAALTDKAFLEKTYKNNLEGKKYLYAELDKLGLEYKKTEANFIFINLKKSADEVFLALMKKGVTIRPLTSFGLPQAIRVSIGTKEQNEKLIEAMKKTLQ